MANQGVGFAHSQIVIRVDLVLIRARAFSAKVYSISCDWPAAGLDESRLTRHHYQVSDYCVVEQRSFSPRGQALPGARYQACARV